MKTLLAASLVLAFSGILTAQQAAEAPTTQQKVEKIIVPTVKFQDATIEQAIEYVRVKSRDLDTITQPPAAKGVSFVLRGGGLTDTISLDLKDVPLIDVVRYCAERVGLQYRVEDHAVVLAASFEEKPAPPAATPPPVIGSADQIVLPTVQFRDATIAAAAEYFKAKSRDLDPAKQGVNIVVKPGGADTRITLDLRNIPLPYALSYAADLSGHQLSTDGQSYLLTPLKAE
jgi:bla regulator protein blaR1